MTYECWGFNIPLTLPIKGDLSEKYLVTIWYPYVRSAQFWQKNGPTRLDQSSVILSLTLDSGTLGKNQRTGWAGDDAYPKYFDSL